MTGNSLPPAHHHIGGRKELFYAEVAANPAFEACREAMDYLVGQIRLMEAKLEQFHTLNLPQQVVHGGRGGPRTPRFRATSD